MIKKLIVALCLTSSTVFAQSITKTDTLTVYTPFSAGSIVDVMCRNLFDSYGKIFKTEAVYKNITGADQIIAHREFIKSNEPAVFCAGNGVAGFNQKVNKDSPAVNTIKPVVDYLKFSQFILTPVAGPDTLDALVARSKQTGKPILVGAPAVTSSKVLTYALDRMGAKYELVLYRKPQEAITSLKDGTLDTYVDGGSIRMMQSQGITGIKEIAHASVTGDRSTTENLIRRWPDIENITSMVIVFARTDASDAEVGELNRRLRQTMASPDVQGFLKQTAPYHNVVDGTPKQSQAKIDQLAKFLNAN